jgi:hypothetical protein
MDYNHIANFLGKLKQTLFKNEEYYDIISLTIKKHISSPIESKLIKIKGTHIYIQGSPMLKNEIFIHKVGILDDLKALLPDRNFTDIR